jgi:hypothetical protein
MTHIMICVSGFSGVGKDEFCSALKRKHAAVQIGMADAAKRHMADLYGFTEQQLFGPSRYRNAGDVRYPKTFSPDEAVTIRPVPFETCKWSDSPVPWVDIVENGQRRAVQLGDPSVWLSPREALQKYCEHMNNMFLETWIRKGLEQHAAFSEGKYDYRPMGGLIPRPEIAREGGMVVTCFADFRHKHEFKAAQRMRSENRHVFFVRIKSERVPAPPYNHRSEVEQTEIPDSDFHFIIKNDSSVEALWDAADTMMEHILGLITIKAPDFEKNVQEATG